MASRWNTYRKNVTASPANPRNHSYSSFAEIFLASETQLSGRRHFRADHMLILLYFFNIFLSVDERGEMWRDVVHTYVVSLCSMSEM